MLSENMKKMIEKLPVILSIKEVASFCQMTYLTVYLIIRHNELTAYKDDEGYWCILRGDFEKYCSRNCNL